jgi:hypothetical protein
MCKFNEIMREEMPKGDEKNIVFDTAKVVLIPAELFEKGTEAEILRFNGMAPSADEVAVVSDERDGIVAVMAVSAFELGEGISMSSPLLTVATGHGGKRRAVDLLLTADNLYLAVWEKGLKMAEALPDNSVDSILYYMQVLGRQFKLRKFDIHVSGRGAEVVVETLRQYYKNVKCGRNADDDSTGTTLNNLRK